jgi:hypothetical protein
VKDVAKVNAGALPPPPPPPSAVIPVPGDVPVAPGSAPLANEASGSDGTTIVLVIVGGGVLFAALGYLLLR